MEWWSKWKTDAEAEFSVPISLLDGGMLLQMLKEYGLYDDVFDIRINKSLDKLESFLYDQGIGHIATVLSPGMIAIAHADCTEDDIRAFYSVDNSFQTMLSVICRGEDIPYAHAPEAVMEACRGDAPVIITGNSGTGKTSLMMRTAVEWVRAGGLAVWLSLSEDDCVTGASANSFYKNLLRIIGSDQRLLLCIDNPYDGLNSLDNLRRYWPRNRKIQLLMAERRNRLDLLADENEDRLHRWFDDAAVVVLEGTGRKYPYALKTYDCRSFYESQEHRAQVVKKCIRFYDPEAESKVEQILEYYGKPTVSLVELLYRTLFRLKQDARNQARAGNHGPRTVSKSADIRLDWDEWRALMRRKFRNQDEAQYSYGMIAACHFFNTPVSVSFFCKYFGLKERVLLRALEELKLTHNIEPVIYLKGTNTLRPKHEVAAELYFLFLRRQINDEMAPVLEAMGEPEIETLLENMVLKRELQYGKRSRIKDIDHWEYLQIIRDRTCRLSPAGLARLCLGFCWCIPKGDRSGRKQEALRIFEELAPPIDDTRLMAMLYTEWGHLLSDLNRNKPAEAKFREVIAADPKNIHSRTELGKLLAKQKGREVEAEHFLREILSLDRDNIQARTELGRLLAKQKGREAEAELFLREAIRIDPKNLHPHTELGRLLAKQKGREAEAEQFLREAIRIDPKNLHPHTELGRLLAKQEGRAAEAEQFLREAMQIDRNHIQSRTELGRLLAKQKGREAEAELFLKEILSLDRENIQARTEIGRLLAKQDGREAEAEQFLREIITIDPKNCHARVELARLCVKLHRPDEARQLYQEVLDLDPGNPYAEKGLNEL